MKGGLLLSAEDGRLRAGWRVLLFLLLYVSILLVLLVPVAGIVGDSILVLSPRTLLLSGFTGAISVTAAITIARRAFDKKTVLSLGLPPNRMARDLLAGIGIAALMMALVFLIHALAGWTTFEAFIWEVLPPAVWALDSLNMILLFILVGVTEELQFRGYVLQNLEEGMGTIGAVAISSLVFALFHLGNPEGAQLAPMAGLLLAGLFFTYAYLRTRSLWLATGLHIGWNFFENTVFGYPVSGIATPGWIVQRTSGPELWTGGAFGPEAGLVLVPAVLLGALLVAIYTRRQ